VAADDNLIADVSDTAFWVAHYRAKETSRQDAMFRDPFAHHLAGERGKKFCDAMGEIGRYIEWSVVSRTVIIDRFIEALLKVGVDAVVNLGAGLDTRPYRKSLPETLEWIEVDQPNIIGHKAHALRSEKPTCNLTRVSVDLADSQKRRAFLASVALRARRVLILTEGVIPYLTSEQVAALSSDLLAQERFTYWIAEYLHATTYDRLKSAGRTAALKQSPFRFFPADWHGFFRKCGWLEKETSYSGELAIEFNRKPPMPRWAEYLRPFMPAKMKAAALRTSGYSIFVRQPVR
jgi:methyltransferase (TIGR00027 family)